MLSILDVPVELQPARPFPYPCHQQGPMIEEFATAYLREHQAEWRLDEDWTYLPVYWTNFAVSTSLLGRSARRQAARRMQSFLGGLPRGRRYFTISQHDDGLTLRGQYRPAAPIFEFSAGGHGDVPIPLLCDPHAPVDRTRDWRASFVGALSTPTMRYPARDAIAAALAGKREYFVRDVAAVWGERDNRSLAAKTADFVDMMCRSVFALCPRGYGKTSFRLYEAMQLGCVPVYIYDEPWLPFADVVDWNELAVLVPIADAPRLHEILASKSPGEIDAMRRRIAETWPCYFTLDAVMRQIPRYLNAATGRDLLASPAPALRRAG